MRTWRPFLTAILAVLVARHAGAESPALEDVGRLTPRLFTDSDGLPQNAVMALARDTRGLLWLATQDGLASFDGHAFSVFNLPDRAISNFVRTVFAASDGSVWVGRQDGGVARLANGVWSTWTAREGLPGGRVHALTEATLERGQVRLWAASSDGTAVLGDDGLFHPLHVASTGLPSTRARALLRARDGAVWLGTNRGVARLVDGRTTLVVDRARGLPHDAVTTLFENDEGIWVGTLGGAACIHGDRVVLTIDARTGLPNDDVSAFAEARDADGGRTLFIATDGGVVRRRNGALLPFATPSLPSQSVYSLLTVDAAAPLREGALMGTRTLFVGLDGGLARIALDGFVTFDSRTGLPSDSVFSLLVTGEGADEALWVGTRGGGVARIHGKGVARWDRSSGLPSNTVFALTEVLEPDGVRRVWAGTQGGLVRRVDDQWVPERPGVSIRSFHTRNGPGGRTVVYGASGEHGVQRWARGRWTPPPLSTVAPDAPRVLSDVVTRAMARNPEDRPTAAEVRDVLRTSLEAARGAPRG